MAGTWASLLSILGFRFCICKLDLKFVDHFPLLSPSDHPGSGPRCDRGIMVPVRSWEIPREKEDEKEQKLNREQWKAYNKMLDLNLGR